MPVWARQDAFASAPGGFGWADAKGRRRTCESMAALSQQVRDEPGGEVFLVWTPDTPHLCLPEEVTGLEESLEIAHSRKVCQDSAQTGWRIRWFAAVLGSATAWQWMVAVFAAGRFGHQSLSARAWFGLQTVLGSTTLGLALLGFVIFGFIPWYQASKQRSLLRPRKPDETTRLIPALRFETWLHLQSAPLTRVLLGLFTVVFLTQFWRDGSLLNAHASTAAAGLVKTAYFSGEWWRLLTAPLLHGGVVHFLMNMAALLYLGKRLEVLARWPHLTLVFLFAACAGGETSARFVQATSVGASGGLMGWLGFLIVFETLHGNLVPRSARRRLVAGVILTGLIGLLGYRFIDNAAHVGGLLAGVVYALIVFPQSSSVDRPGTNLADRLAGTAALLVLLAAATTAVLHISGR